jgi:NADH:ubiquinone oxidoreductase subunit 5 (subunit L)/multisubunit Na+/H+ antiporter MnhA subunit
MHADRSNRAALIVFAALVAAVGALGVAASYGLFGSSVKHETMLDNAFARFVGRNGEWFWIVVALLALLLVLLAVRWLLTILFSTDRTASMRISSDGPGRTELSSGALTDAVSAEIDGYRGVNAARARVIGDPQDAELVVVVTVEEGADLPGLVARIESEALAHAREALGNPSLQITLDLAVTTKRSSRVA